MLREADALLHAVSAWGTASFARFAEAVDVLLVGGMATDLASQDLYQVRRRAMQTLDALGHCEAIFRTGELIIASAPPTLALLPLPGLPQAILCGARSPSTIDVLQRACGDVTITVEEHGLSIFEPIRVVFQARQVDDLRNLATNAGLNFDDYPASFGLIAMSGTVAEYMGSLKWEVITELNWERWDFDPRQPRFRRSTDERPSVRLTRYTHPKLGQRFRFWRGSESAQVTDPSWARYAIFRAQGQTVLAYHDDGQLLVAPSDAPLPRLLARALTLTAGHAAVPSEHRIPSLQTTRLDEYRGVPSTMFNHLSVLLGAPPSSAK